MARSNPPRRLLAALLMLVSAPAVSACRIEVTSGAPVAPPAPAAPVAPAAPSTRAAAASRPAPPAGQVPQARPPSWEADAPAPDPEARRLFLARAAQPAAALEVAAKPPRVTALALDNTARGEAPGMSSEGGARSASLAEGQVAVLPITLAPGECATFIAQGGLGLVEVDLFLTASGSRQVLAEDPSSGPIAVIGGRGACFTPPGAAPFPAELHVQARRGAGVVLVQGYRRAARP